MASNLSVRTLLILSLLIAIPSVAFAEDKATPRVSLPSGACGDSESWSFSSVVDLRSAEKFRNLLSGKRAPALAFTDAIVFGTATGEEAKAFSRYWKARALYEADLVQPAHQAFEQLVAEDPSQASLGAQLAAAECLNKYRYDFPSILLSSKTSANLAKLADFAALSNWPGSSATVMGETAVARTQALIAESSDSSSVEPLIASLPEQSPYRLLAQGLWATKNKGFADAVRLLSAFLKQSVDKKVAIRNQELARITLARSYHQSGKFTEAIEQIKAVRNDSNYTVRLMNELAWSHLMKAEYSEAIGIALNLQKGSFGNTFTPEGLVVMAMGFNEICQYPSAFRSIRLFHRNYRTSHEWLTQWYKARASQKNALYPLLAEFVEKEKTSVPMPVMTEWIRSPLFISHQEELNQLVEEPKLINAFRTAQRKELKDLAQKAKDMTLAINQKIRKHKQQSAAAKKAGAAAPPFPEETRKQLEEVKEARTYFKHFRSAFTELDKLAKVRVKEREARRKRALDLINWDLGNRNIRMLARLRELIETAYLVQVEIYNGASDDIVWKNAHPDYEKFIQEMKNENRPDPAKVLDWGTTAEVGGKDGEVWEDEIDSMRAMLSNNCSNRDKFLKVQYKKRQQEKREQAKETPKAGS